MTPPPNASANGTPPPQIERGTSGWPPAWAAAAVLAIAIGAVYYHSLDVPFIFDDVVGIEKNESIYSLWPLVGATNHPGPLNPVPDLPSSGRPLVNLSFALNYAMGGDNPSGYHALNVAIHFLAALLLWAIVRRALRLPCFAGRFMRSANWLALATALIWSLHPLQTEAVVYLTQRTELMMAILYLATLYCSLRYWSALPLPPGEGRDEGESLPTRQQRATWLVLAFLSCLCGMASKEVMVSAPLMVLLFERTFIAGSLANALRRSWPLYVALASTWLLLLALNIGLPRAKSAGFGLGPPLISWWLTQARLFLIYLKLVVWPWPLLIHYHLPYPQTFAQASMYAIPVLLLALTTLFLLWRNKPIGFLGCWVFAILSPTSLVPILTEMGAERRMYLPLAAFAALFVVAGCTLAQAVLRRVARSRYTSFCPRRMDVMAAVPVVVVALMLGLVSAKRVAAYDDELGLWQDVLRFQPRNYSAYINRGLLLAKSGRLPEAISELHAAVAIKPDDPIALNKLGLAFQQVGRPQEALDAIRAALKMDPDYPAALNNLALAFLDLGRPAEATEKLQHALQLQPGYALAHNNLGIALFRMGQIPQAIEHFRLATELDDRFAGPHISWGLVLAAQGNFGESIGHFEQAIQLGADQPDVHNSLGDAYRKSGQAGRAIEHYRAAVRLKPDYLLAYANLARTLAQVERPQEATAAAEMAIEVARSNGKDDEVEHIEEWLKHYQIELRRGAGAASPSQPPPPQNSRGNL